jgi:hypothetical protein
MYRILRKLDLDTKNAHTSAAGASAAALPDGHRGLLDYEECVTEDRKCSFLSD